MGINQTRKHNQPTSINDLVPISDLTANGGDEAICDRDVGGLLSSREDDHPPSNNDVASHLGA